MPNSNVFQISSDNFTLKWKAVHSKWDVPILNRAVKITVQLFNTLTAEMWYGPHTGTEKILSQSSQTANTTLIFKTELIFKICYLSL